MSITSARIIFTPPKKKMVGSIAIDVFESETYSRSSNMTEYPIEDGSKISDHTVNEPLELDLKAFIGVDGQNFYNPLGSSFSFTDVFDQINALMDNKELVTVVMGLDVYDNMHIESFEVQRDATTGQGLPFSMHLKQAVYVTSQTISGSNSSQLFGQTNSTINNGKATSGQTQSENELIKAYKKGQADVKNF